MDPADERTAVPFRFHFGGARYGSAYIIRSSEPTPHTVMPAQAGTHEPLCRVRRPWVPASAGMTLKQGDTGAIELDMLSYLPIT
jgi:hypothetical protein